MTNKDLEPIDIDSGAPDARKDTRLPKAALAIAVVATLAAVVASGLTAAARHELDQQANNLDALRSRQETLEATVDSQRARIDVLERQRLLTTVPNVEGLELGVAQRVLTGAMLTGVVDPATPPGRSAVVVRQDPPAGTETTRGMRVVLNLEDQ